MSDDRNQALFVISVAAELAGMHPQTLRIYERRGLLEPFRTPGGTRRYSQEDIDRLAVIQELSEQGLNLEGIKLVLQLRARVRDLERENDRLAARLEKVRDRIQYLVEDQKEPTYEIVLHRTTTRHF